ncbi:MAG TPA: hypothetical protein VJN72_10310 [Gaiellales bacterium]|nr:hypothetical protein [Gaiellales bacterium]
MAGETATEFVAECLWPDVHEADLRALDARVGAESTRASVRYLGSLLMRQDEVVLCLFRGAEEDVRRVVEAARIPCDRLLEAACSPWPTEHH